MSKKMRSAPIWLGGACSNEAFLSGRLAVVPNSVIEQLQRKQCDNLNYVQSEVLKNKQIEALTKNSDRFVQKILFSRGGKFS
jgi:hypothetical protein